MPTFKSFWFWKQDDVEEVPVEERRIRHFLEFLYRFALSIFLSCHLFDFLFNPVWMHGYLWCLNLPIELDMSDKSAGIISEYQLELIGDAERIFHSMMRVLGIVFILRLCGYHQSNKSVWHLFNISIIFGAVAGLARCTQIQHRLYSALHEIFFIYLNFFIVGFCMTIRFTEKLKQE